MLNARTAVITLAAAGLAEVKTSGRTITITAHGRSAKAPMCCPDRLIVRSYRWRDGEFRRTRSTVDPL